MLSEGMRSPWEDETGEQEDQTLYGRGNSSNELLGQILERSTSAPPLPSERNADIGILLRDDKSDSSESYLFGNGRRTPPTSRLGLYDTSGRGTAPVSSGDGGGGFIPRYEDRPGRSTAPGLYSGEDTLFGTRSRRSLIDDDDLSGGGDDEAFLFQERGMLRSQSAAPLMLRESKSLGPPPGYGMNQRSRSTGTNEGLQRSASTGVIGGQQKNSSSVLRSLGLDSDGTDLGAVRPAPKTLMDLIQEDFPTSPSPVYKPEQEDLYHSGETNSHSLQRTAPQYDCVDDGHYGMDQRERQNRIDEERYRMEQQERAMYSQQRDPMGNLTRSMDQMRVSQRDEYVGEQQGLQYVLPPQRSDQMYREYAQEPRQQRPMYAPIDRDGRGQPPPQQSGQYYQSQPVYYNEGRQPRNGPQMSVAPSQPVQAQLLPSGQTVYVNAPPPTYGYSTPQYHPGAIPQSQQQHRVVHLAPQPIQSGLPPHEQQYISVVPVQGGTRGQMTQVQAQGGYTYWQQQDVASPSAQNLSPNSYGHGGGTPTAMHRAPMDSPGSGGRRQRGARSPSERVGSTRRGGRGRRGGAESQKHSSGSSLLLEEFRASKTRDWSVIDIKGHVVEFCQDQNGSRFIQQRLEIGDLQEKEIVIIEVLPEVHQLRNDVFGNYVVQKLLEYGTPEMRADLRDTLTGEMLALSLQMYGCRVVQKALEMLDEDDLPQLLREFHHNVLSCIQDQNGNHVIQKCVEVMSTRVKEALAAGNEAKAQYASEQIDFIIDDVLANVASLSCHPYGCRVLQRILEHCVEPKKGRTLDEICKCHRQLLDDQYGNYVIQHVLQYGRHSDRESILQIVVEGGLLPLSKQKFASNVVEKLLKYGSPGQRNAIVREMLKEVDEHTGAPMESGGTSVALLMVRDAYANYVVQTALDVVPEGEEKRMLLEELTSHSAELVRTEVRLNVDYIVLG